MDLGNCKISNRTALEEVKNIATILKYLDFSERCRLRAVSKYWDKAICLSDVWRTVDLRWIKNDSKYLKLAKKQKNFVKSLKLALDFTNSNGFNILEFDYNDVLNTYKNLKNLEVFMLRNDTIFSFISANVANFMGLLSPNNVSLSSLVIDANITIPQLCKIKVDRLDFLVLTRIIIANKYDISLLSEFLMSLTGLQVLQLTFTQLIEYCDDYMYEINDVYNANINYSSMRRIERIKALTGSEYFTPGDELIQALIDSHSSSLVCLHVSLISIQAPDLEISYECYTKALPKLTKLESFTLPGWTALDLLI